MPGHEFQPGKLVAGVFLTGAAVAFGGDARGLWSVPWFAMLPIVVVGLCLAAVAGIISYPVRHRRRRDPRPGAGSRRPGPPSAGPRPHGPEGGDGPDGPEGSDGPDRHDGRGTHDEHDDTSDGSTRTH